MKEIVANKVCPKCSYRRKATDDSPEWQCPACKVAYNKVEQDIAAPPVSEGSNDTSEEQSASASATKCPSCNYERLADDVCPEWQCPQCGVAYEKVQTSKLINDVQAISTPNPPSRFPLIGSLALLLIGIGIGVSVTYEGANDELDKEALGTQIQSIAEIELAVQSEVPENPAVAIAADSSVQPQSSKSTYVYNPATTSSKREKINFNPTTPSQMFDLANRYYAGNGVTKNLVKARYWYMKSAALGHWASGRRLATMNAKGEGLPDSYTGQNTNSGVTSVSVKQMHKNGLAFYHGHGRAKDLQQARYWFKLGMEAGNHSSKRYYEHMVASGEGLPERTATNVRTTSSTEDLNPTESLAQYKLAWRYQQGNGLRRDYRKAFEWMKKSAEQGYPPAKHSLAHMYEDGQGTSKNPTEAFNWFLSSANSGNKDSFFAVAYAYDTGKGVMRDLGQAERWYRAAAGNGDIGAMNNLSLIYKNQSYSGYSLERAFEWAKKSALNGNGYGQNTLGTMYQSGQGVGRDWSEALAWYIVAARNGSPHAPDNLRRLENRISDERRKQAEERAQLYIRRYSR